jgi:hypothetical protein
MSAKKQLLLQFWSCSDAPDEIRKMIPEGFKEGWIAHLPKELFQDEVLLALFQEKEKWETHVVRSADGSGLVIGRSAGNATPALAWLSEQIAKRQLK